MNDVKPARRTARPRNVIGLNSGTSLGSLDLVWAQFEGSPRRPRWRLIEHAEVPFAAELEARLQALAQGRGAVRELAEADRLYGEAAAAAVATCLGRWKLSTREISVIGCHGQTVYHHCGMLPAATLQIGSGAFLAQRIGVPVACDFRSRDLAVGGEGAPLSPLLDEVLFARERGVNIVVNLGGISNASVVERGALALGFDGGPANVQLDLALRWASANRERIDRDGQRARRGTPQLSYLGQLRSCYQSWFDAAAPRSSGREQFGERDLLPLLERWGAAHIDDILATLAQFAAQSFRARLRRFAPRLFATGAPRDVRIWWTGGGAKNRGLVSALAQALAPWPCAPLDQWSGAAATPLQAAREALLFALLADRRRAGVPSDTRSATGALEPTILGCLWS